MNNLIDVNLVTATVVGISWERITVYIDIKLDVADELNKTDELQFYAVNGLYAAKAIFRKEKLDDDTYRLSINLTNPGDVRCLPIGTYKIYVCCNEDILAYCVADPAITSQMEDLSRNFLYSNRNAVYAVTFMVEEGEEDLPFVMHTLSARRTGMGFPSDKKKTLQLPSIEEYKKKNSKPFLRKLYSFYRNKYKKKAGNSKVILFMSEQSDKLGGNLTAVYQRMVDRKMDKEYILLTSARMASSQRQSQKSWIELIKKLAMSDIVFLDEPFRALDDDNKTRLADVISGWAGNAPVVFVTHDDEDIRLLGADRVISL